MKNHIAELWRTYQMTAYKALLPPDGDQHRECQMSFFTGAFLVLELVDLVSQVDEDIGAETMKEIYAELQTFLGGPEK